MVAKTMDKILAAVELFSLHGLRGVGIERSGVAKSTRCVHFRTMEEFVAEYLRGTDGS